MIFVTPDLHGNHELARALLLEAEVIDVQDKRIPGPTSVQLGDLINAVPDSHDDDLRMLELAPDWFDLVLVGNHDYPYLGGSGFGGFSRFAEIEDAVRRLQRTGIWQPCARVGDTLLTHAGVTPDWTFATAAQAHVDIYRCWRDDRRGPLFGRVGYARGGFDHLGGILWSDAGEPRSRCFNQVHGHSVDREGPTWLREGDWFSVNLDVGGGRGAGRLVGLWLDEDGRPGDVVEVTL